MRRKFDGYICDRCSVERDSRTVPTDWFKIDIFSKDFASMKERHFCPTCGPLLVAVIEEKT